MEFPAPASPLKPVAFQTRFLFVFRLLARTDASVSSAAGLIPACREILLRPADAAGRPAWEAPAAPDAACHQPGAFAATLLREGYLRELLPVVCDLLFPGPTAGHAFYLRVAESGPASVDGPEQPVRSPLAGSLDVRPPWDVPARFAPRSLHGGAGEIELFLLDFPAAPGEAGANAERAGGLGVLSIRLGAEAKNGLELDEIRELNYFLSQRTHRPAAVVGRRFPEPGSPGWQQLSLERRSVIEQTLDWEAWRRDRRGSGSAAAPALPPLAARLRHGWFTLEELRVWLLAPLAELAQIEPVQGQFAVFTAVRFPAPVHFSDPAVCHLLAPALSALAQIEEKDHAGSRPGEVTVPHAVLNACHWAAVGGQGAAHFLCDQHRPAQGFDHQRLQVVMDRYFLPHLLVLLQDAGLQRLAQAASALAQQDLPAEAQAAGLRRLRAALARFHAVFLPPQVSDREAHNRHYRLVQDALHTPAASAAARRAVADLDALAAEAARQRLVERVEASIHAIGEAQTKVEYVEIFLVGVYSIYATHYLGHHFHFADFYVGAAIIGVSLFAALLAAMKMQLWRHARTEPGRQPFWPSGFIALATAVNARTATLPGLLRAVFILLGLYLLLGFTLFRSGGH